MKKLKKLKIMTSQGYREVKRRLLEPMETESPRSSTARSSKKREFDQTEPNLDVEEQELSTKRRVEEWMSFEDVEGLWSI